MTQSTRSVGKKLADAFRPRINNKSSQPRLHFQNEKFLPLIAELNAEGTMVTIIAMGNSMRPFIESGHDELVFYKFDALKVGDVILAEVDPGHYVCHRIETIENGIVTMRGDGNVVGTETFPIENVRAKLVKINRNGKVYDLETSRAWKIYSAIWPKLFPVRRYLLALYKLLWLHQLPERFRRIKS